MRVLPMKSKRSYILKLIPYIVLTLVGVPIAGMTFNEGLKISGYKTIPVEVVGTGSMYPSLFWSTVEGGPEDESKSVVQEYRTTPHLYKYFRGLNFAGNNFFSRKLAHGDMVAFKNSKTREILTTDNKDQENGFIKRVIALAGDTVELRDGFVYINNILIQEPYVYSPRSTYGGTTLKDCEKLIVPTGSLFVLGDNRKVSSDSRFELGVINDADVEFVLPYNEQKIYHSLYRDTSKDDALLGQPTLSATEFVNLVNAKRISLNLPKLKESTGLNKSSALRGDKLLLDENTNYSMQQALEKVGYSNIVLGEFVSRGRFTAKELLDNLLYQPGSTKQILNNEYSDLGVSAVTREIAGCPTQIIVGHLGGYIPATYDRSTINSWVELKSNLTEIIPTWEKAIGYNNLDQQKLSTLLSILRTRQSLATEIVDVMNKKEWFTKNQQERIEQDKLEANKAESLAKELNKE